MIDRNDIDWSNFPPIISIDFETYYDPPSGYSLSKMSTEAYIRDPRFEVIGVSVKVRDTDSIWLEEAAFREFVARVPWHQYQVLAYHTNFDGGILAWHYGVRPLRWLDSLSMARAMVAGQTKDFRLKTTGPHFGTKAKGDEVVRAAGKRRADFSPSEWAAYGRYSNDDNDISYQEFWWMLTGHHAPYQSVIPRFPEMELDIIDAHIRMFTEPAFILDRIGLRAHLAGVQQGKEDALREAGITNPKDLMSGAKFASILTAFGVDPPMKVSPTNATKMTYAFAKTDKAMEALLEHEDPRVQAVVAARLKVKSTLEETRTVRLIEMADRGVVPVYLNYAGAFQTQRGSGGDGVNWQNNPRGGMIRWCLAAPPGHKVVSIDSSNIEARVVDMLAGEEWAIQTYKDADAGKGPDIYCVMAGRVYNRPVTKADKLERQFGKVLKLACGFGMGGEKFKETARTQGKSAVTPKGIIISLEEAQNGVNIYRNAHPMVKRLWYAAEDLFDSMHRGAEAFLSPCNLVRTAKDCVILPTGTVLRYHNIRKTPDGWVYDSQRSTVYIYGGKFVENIVQKIARDIVMEQCMQIRREFHRWNMPVHDEGVFVVPNAMADRLAQRGLEIFRTSPTWWPDIPLNAEAGVARRYGET